MKPYSSFTIVAGAMALGLLSACTPSPYYSSDSSGGLAPGAVPRDGMGRPVLNGKAIEYTLPPPSQAVRQKAAQHSAENKIIYFNDLYYPGHSAQMAGNNESIKPVPAAR